jgi:DNA mismatch endonuclease, patch repair protein
MKGKHKLTRPEQMSRIRGKNTSPERRLRSALWRAGLRYRIHAKTPFGQPDVVFPKRAVAVFIDGCFWHGCPQHYVRPRSHTGHWENKLRENVERDRQQTLTLESLGWRVFRIWEHEVYESLDCVISQIHSAVADEKGSVLAPDWRVVLVEEIGESTRWERRYLESLRNPQATLVEEGRRVTTKWRRLREN